jgi:hypothetical protein
LATAACAGKTTGAQFAKLPHNRVPLIPPNSVKAAQRPERGGMGYRSAEEADRGYRGGACTICTPPCFICATWTTSGSAAA